MLISLICDLQLYPTYLPFLFCLLPPAMLRRSVWICGHSIVHGARVRAVSCGLAYNLGVRVSWLSRRGMRWEELMPLLWEKVAKFGPPDILVIHLGENDLANRGSVDLLWSIKET